MKGLKIYVKQLVIYHNKLQSKLKHQPIFPKTAGKTMYIVPVRIANSKVSHNGFIN